MGATTIFCFSCETNILHIISRFYVGIWVLSFEVIKISVHYNRGADCFITHGCR